MPIIPTITSTQRLNCDPAGMGSKTLYTLLLSALAIPGSLVADAGSVPLQKDASFPSVLKAWGAPVEKKDRETSRKEEWYYPNGKVLFLEGRVVTWEGPALSPVQAVADVKGPEKREVPIISETEEVLREILKEVPSDPNAVPSPDTVSPMPNGILQPLTPMPLDAPLIDIPGGQGAFND